MKKWLVSLIFFFLLFIPNVEAKDVNLYLFYGDGCPHCAKEEEYLKDLEEDYPFINIIKYETWYNEENAKLLSRVKSNLNVKNSYVPFTVIGNLGLTGFNDNTKMQIESKIKYCYKNDCVDIVDQTCNEEEIKIEEDCEEEVTTFSLPILGEVDAKKVSLPIVAIVMGFVDGFNPCAMWILIFLISFLITNKDYKKMLILGSTFLVTSAIIYLFFMMSWLTIVIEMNKIVILRNIIAIIACVAGIYNLIKFNSERKKEVGCSVTDNKKRSVIIERIKRYVLENNLALSMLGIMALAVSVNFIELACSAGLPLVFTQILSINDLSSIEYFMYVLIYVLFFLIDDLIIFGIAVKTSKVTGISNKYTKYSHLIGGLIMLIIGIFLLVKPEIVMFNF